jgi:hypothetical protein
MVEIYFVRFEKLQLHFFSGGSGTSMTLDAENFLMIVTHPRLSHGKMNISLSTMTVQKVAHFFFQKGYKWWFLLRGYIASNVLICSKSFSLILKTTKEIIDQG